MPAPQRDAFITPEFRALRNGIASCIVGFTFLLSAGVAGGTGCSKGGHDETRVTLISAGQEPRRELRYELNVGREQRFKMTASMGSEMKVPGRPRSPQRLPTFQLALDTILSEALPGNRARHVADVTSIAMLDDGSKDTRR